MLEVYRLTFNEERLWVRGEGELGQSDRNHANWPLAIKNYYHGILQGMRL